MSDRKLETRGDHVQRARVTIVYRRVQARPRWRASSVSGPVRGVNCTALPALGTAV
jgi:hypothetical protein